VGFADVRNHLSTARMRETWRRKYPHLPVGQGGVEGDFDADVLAENAPRSLASKRASFGV
jgi:hypothetical protein